MTILLNTIFILFIGIWFVRFFVEMDVPEKYRVSRFFQNTTDYKGEGLTKKDVLRILFLAFLIRVLIYFASVSIWCNQIFYHMQLHFPGMIFSICGINLMPSIILISRKKDMSIAQK